MTDNEIIKVLECCGKEYSCEKCALNTWLDEKRDCIGAILVNALDLINRLQDEKQALINGQETLQNTIVEQKAEIERLNDELQRAKVEISKHFDYMDEVANEALDVFADSLKIKLNRTIDNLVKEMTEVETNQRKEDEKNG